MPRHLMYAACAAVIFTTSACGADALGQSDERSAPALSPAEMEAALQGREMSVRSFYAARQNQAAWTEADAKALTEAIGKADRQGLDPAPYLKLIPPEGGDLAARDVGLTRAALAYAGALSSGVVDPTTVNPIWELDGNRLNPAPGLTAALSRGEVGEWLASLAPQDKEYVALSEAYVSYRKLAETTDWPRVPEGAKLVPGGRDVRLAALQARLAVEGYLPASAADAPAPARYGPDLVEAVKRFQADHGLNDDGVIGGDTAEALSESPGDRAARIAVNLERRRWLSRIVPETRIDVNTASTVLTYWRDGVPVHVAKVVAGRPKDPTPSLGSPFNSLVVNPPWVVPASIARKEIGPKGGGYLRSHGMSWRDGQIVQRPGPKNSLGQVKFDMDNPHSIYLHDTPSKDLFAENERHLSHGCVRVEGAVDFARELAEESGKGAEFDAALASGKTERVELGRSVPVRLLYHTVFVDADGRVAFRPDVYGWDDDLARAMGVKGRDKLAAAADVTAPLGP
ncbi:L,D-transpeptidase family protein [Caulobacter sp. 17J65-9]|uniref:L,D-transpeptidase family protein n=1 Tax=Caulobacter sp. 17J65-9 TaxID=2709382 RepID=UPI0013C7B161|nr:L,D-transpeptidase family protein [Caulobacter sp. 17J65-9]NEX93903.1 L,D-transpeptidase family protein [Caulobacter sp. 17J65-9]